jgi:hypothetical protein
MKAILHAAILLGAVLSGCAPVASSVPKLATRAEHPDGDTALAENARDLRANAKDSRVFTASKMSKIEKELAGYEFMELKSDQVEQFLEKHRVAVNLGIGVKSVDVVPLFELAISDEQFESKAIQSLPITVTRDRDYPETLWISYAKDAKSSADWSAIQKSKPSIHIAYKIVR